MVAKKPSSRFAKKSREENLTNYFPKGIFQWNLAQIEEHEYIYIFEIKFDKIILLENVGQNKFWDIAQ